MCGVFGRGEGTSVNGGGRGQGKGGGRGNAAWRVDAGIRGEGFATAKRVCGKRKWEGKFGVVYGGRTRKGWLYNCRRTRR